jgi:hypothetical protein
VLAFTARSVVTTTTEEPSASEAPSQEPLMAEDAGPSALSQFYSVNGLENRCSESVLLSQLALKLDF